MKCIALLLSVIMIVGCLPINAFATEVISMDTVQTSNSDIIVESQECISDDLIDEIVEIGSLREENVKHFRLADGTYEAVIYSEAVHRKDSDGVWQDIDNNLTLQSIGGKQQYLTTDSRICFADKFEINSQLFSLNENGYSISMTLIGETTAVTGSSHLSIDSMQIETSIVPIISNASVRSDSTSYNSLEEAARIDNASSIIYNDIRPNIDIEYVLRGNDVKENIVVNATSDGYVYVFEMNLDGLTAELNVSGDIKIREAENGQSKYIIPAPYMYDANGIISYDVAYELNMISADRYILTIIADDEWINSDERAFPVTIDPTITQDWTAYDSYISSGYPNTNYGDEECLWVSSTKTALIQMRIPSLPVGATFNNAYLYVSYYYWITDGSLVAGAYQILEDWEASSVTYNNAPNISTTRLSVATLSASPSITESTPGVACFQITDAVSDWYDDADTNYGIAIKRESGTNGSVILKSYEAYDNDYAYISVNYTYYVPDGVYALRTYSYLRWMTVEDDSPWEGNHIQQEYSSTSPADASVFDRSSLFKISRVGSTSRYIIRSMVNNNLSFGISGTEIITKEIPSADEDVSASDTFYIEWDGYGFLIRPYNSSYVINMSPTTANLTTVEISNDNLSARWKLVQYTGNHRNGTEIYFLSSWRSVGIVVGDTDDVTFKVWSTYINANTPYMEIDSEYEAIGRATWNSTNNKLTFTAKNPGTIRFNAYIRCGLTTTTVYLGYYSFSVVPQQGTYYIQNVSTTKYIDVEGPSLNSGAIIQQWKFHTGTQEKWIIEHVSNSNGYIRLKSVYSNLYLGVDSNNTSVIRQYSSLNDYTLWKIERTSSNNSTLTCKATELSEIVLAVPLTSNINGTDLTQIAYTDDSNYRDEWYIVNKVISYVNYYDSTFVGNSTLIQNIELANSFANLVFAKYFQIGMYMEGAAIQYDTIADACQTGKNVSCSNSSCGANCYSNHHKNANAISNQLYNDDRKDDHIYVLWSNRAYGTYCNETNGIHQNVSWIAVVYGYRPVIHFMTIDGNSIVQEACMTLNLVHETVHTFGMYDVYDNDGHDVPGACVCVMERFDSIHAYAFYQDILNGVVKPFCTSCEETLYEYTSSLHLIGN